VAVRTSPLSAVSHPKIIVGRFTQMRHQARGKIVRDYQAAFHAVVSDPRYQENLDWGRSRHGHPEGSVRAHIHELEHNLAAFRHRMSEMDYWNLKLLAHTHDAFKAEARLGVKITDPRSHASLAREFLAQYCDDPDLLAMVQYHDEPYALYRQWQSKGTCQPRLAALLATIKDWNLFVLFNLIDGCTAGKNREHLFWLLGEVAAAKLDCDVTEQDVFMLSC
jgi:hypothetical protein